MRVDSLLLREARETDLGRLLSFRNAPDVNRFMIHTCVEPEMFRREWLAVPESETDFSCVAEAEEGVVAMGFLDIVDGTGQPGMPQCTEGHIGYIVEPRFAGRGYATSIAHGLLGAAFDHLDCAASPRDASRTTQHRHECWTKLACAASSMASRTRGMPSSAG